jgi:hypothetical protein
VRNEATQTTVAMSLQEQVNFCFPLRVLANDKVKLVPLEVSHDLDTCNIANKP